MPDADGKKRVKAAPIRAVVDRIEDGGQAVLLIGDAEQAQIDFPVSLLPEGVRDGDHLKINITVDKGARASAEDRIKKLQEQLTQKSGADEKKDFKL
ncbi:MAG: DUF3006 domain-containing protein [Pyrinomonadaceae bacterium]|nr:DUF3006 domain-containing protein [Pyrinomonadaceae bacterium]